MNVDYLIVFFLGVLAGSIISRRKEWSRRQRFNHQADNLA